MTHTVTHTCIYILKFYSIKLFFLSFFLFLSDPKSFSNSSTCGGGYSYGCTNGPCQYRATWLVKGNHVQFNVTGRVPMGQWLAIGFSDNRLMVKNWLLLHTSVYYKLFHSVSASD